MKWIDLCTLEAGTTLKRRLANVLFGIGLSILMTCKKSPGQTDLRINRLLKRMHANYIKYFKASVKTEKRTRISATSERF